MRVHEKKGEEERPGKQPVSNGDQIADWPRHSSQFQKEEINGQRIKRPENQKVRKSTCKRWRSDCNLAKAFFPFKVMVSAVAWELCMGMEAEFKP